MKLGNQFKKKLQEKPIRLEEPLKVLGKEYIYQIKWPMKRQLHCLKK